jgi:prolyl-tRNA synthetase
MKLVGSSRLAAVALDQLALANVEVDFEPSDTSGLVFTTASGETISGVKEVFDFLAQTYCPPATVAAPYIKVCLGELSFEDNSKMDPIKLMEALPKLEATLTAETFLTSNTISISDFAIYEALSSLVATDTLDLGNYHAISRWFQSIQHCPAVKATAERLSALELSLAGCSLVDADDDNKALQLLKELKIDAPTFSHQPVNTVEKQRALRTSIAGTFTKNLFLRDKKHGLYLVTVEDDQEVNLKAIAGILNLGGCNFRFADEALLQEHLQVIKGSLGPLALMHASPEVKFAVDKALLEEGRLINSHPLRSDRTTSLTPEQLSLFLAHLNVEPIVLDFTKQPTAIASVAKSSAKKSKAAEKKKDENKKGETKLGLSVKKDEDFSLWYTQVITLSEMIDYSDISGCYILRPWSYFIWEQIQGWFDAEIKKLGVKNTYFPMFASEKALNTEKDHVEGFAPEVAWVTKSGSTDLAEPIAVRPTSETIMYPFFAKWIRSHRDLPLEINQWCNVVRWEFKDATPFLRSREFLWQEGHTAHTTYEEAQARVLCILDLYAKVYEYLLAVPVTKGMKTEMEKFAGGFHTTTVEAYINGSGRAIQGATSHNLGQNFGKMFKILYETETGDERAIPWQTSWGLTTRSIGVAVMVHGDDKGLVLPPRVAPVQVIICPILKKDVADSLLEYSRTVEALLKAAGVRVELDARMNYTPGWKFNHWEQKGVPVRLEIGLRDVESQQCRLVRRDTGEKSDVSTVTGLAEVITTMLDNIHDHLFQKSKAERDAKTVTVYEWKDFVPALEKSCLIMTPFCDETEWEEEVKSRSREEALAGATEEDTCATSAAGKSLCKPFDQPPLPEGTKCFISGKPAKFWVLWGRSY